MLSKKCTYAIHALVYLAEKMDEGPVHIQEISEKKNIPRKFLEAILLELNNAKVLEAKRGKGGGYFLRKRPEEINLIDIIRLMDGAIALLPCVSLNYYEPCNECVDEHTCGLRSVLIHIRDETLGILSRSNLAQIVRKEKTMRRQQAAARTNKNV